MDYDLVSCQISRSKVERGDFSHFLIPNPGDGLNNGGFPCKRRQTVPRWIMSDMTMAAPPGDPVVQFSIFTANRLGRLHALVNLLGSQTVHVLALTVLDTSDSAIIRIVVDDPDKARSLLRQNDFPFAETKLVVTEVNSTEELGKLMAALLEAELSINYLYSFIPHPRGKSMLAISVEDNDLAAQTLKRHNFQVLNQADISR